MGFLWQWHESSEKCQQKSVRQLPAQRAVVASLLRRPPLSKRLVPLAALTVLGACTANSPVYTEAPRLTPAFCASRGQLLDADGDCVTPASPDMKDNASAATADLHQSHIPPLPPPTPDAPVSASTKGVTINDNCAPVDCSTGACDRLIREAQATPVSHLSCFDTQARRAANVIGLFRIALNAVRDENRVYCAKNKPLACSMHMQATLVCPQIISELSQIFSMVDAMESGGMTPNQAARQINSPLAEQAVQIPQNDRIASTWRAFLACLNDPD